MFSDMSYFFFFKQKTAYEMRISDWSSDVCSSDLVERIGELSQSSKDVDEVKAFSLARVLPGKRVGAWTFAVLVLLAFLIGPIWAWHSYRGVDERPQGFHADQAWLSGQIGRASCREGVCRYG